MKIALLILALTLSSCAVPIQMERYDKTTQGANIEEAAEVYTIAVTWLALATIYMNHQ